MDAKQFRAQVLPRMTAERIEQLTAAIEFLDSIEEYDHADAIRMIMPLEGFDPNLPVRLQPIAN